MLFYLQMKFKAQKLYLDFQNSKGQGSINFEIYLWSEEIKNCET